MTYNYSYPNYYGNYGATNYATGNTAQTQGTQQYGNYVQTPYPAAQTIL